MRVFKKRCVSDSVNATEDALWEEDNEENFW
jgi:hypothetical protein